jgi:hypothetical protein
MIARGDSKLSDSDRHFLNLTGKSAIGNRQIANWQYIILFGSFFVCLARARLQGATLIAGIQLSSGAPSLYGSFIRAEPGATIYWQHAFNLRMGPWYHVHANQFPNSTSRSCTGIGSSLYGTHISSYKYRDITGTDILLSQELNISCFDHGIGGLNSADKSFGLNHSECF